MRRSKQRTAAVLAACALVGALVAGCTGRPSAAETAPGAGHGGGAPTPGGLLAGGGLVIDDGEKVEMCVGLVLDSFAPQCADGLRLQGWSWDGIDSGFERLDKTRWGDFRVVGHYDAEVETLTVSRIEALPLASPAPPPVSAAPSAVPTVPSAPSTAFPVDGPGSVADQVSRTPGVRGPLMSAPDRMTAIVIYDEDDTLQHDFDARFGPGVVTVESFLVRVP